MTVDLHHFFNVCLSVVIIVRTCCHYCNILSCLKFNNWAVWSTTYFVILTVYKIVVRLHWLFFLDSVSLRLFCPPYRSCHGVLLVLSLGCLGTPLIKSSSRLEKVCSD